MYPMQVFIMAVPFVPKRTKRAVELQRETGGTVVWDSTQNAWDTWQKTLLAVGNQPAVILEDDVQLAADWLPKVEAAISEHPDDLIQFFSRRAADAVLGSRWQPGRSYLMNQCHYLPSGMAHSLRIFTRDWHDRHPEHPTGTDSAIADYLRSRKMRYWLHVPSLVQHEPWRSEINPTRSSATAERNFPAVSLVLAGADPAASGIPEVLHQIWVGSQPPAVGPAAPGETWDDYMAGASP